MGRSILSVLMRRMHGPRPRTRAYESEHRRLGLLAAVLALLTSMGAAGWDCGSVEPGSDAAVGPYRAGPDSAAYDGLADISIPAADADAQDLANDIDGRDGSDAPDRLADQRRRRRDAGAVAEGGTLDARGSDLDACEAVTCSGHGTCRIADGSPICNCEDGFSAVGLTCSAKADGSACTGKCLYVSPDGSDSNAGTQSSPFRTIQKAADIVTPGTTVLVAPGTYPERIHVTRSGTSSGRISFVAARRWESKIHPVGDGPTSTSGTNWRTWAIIFVDGSYVDFNGFDIAPAAGGYRQIGVSIQGDHSRLLYSRVHDINTRASGGTGSCTGSEGTDVVFEGNIVFNCGHSTLDHGIYIASGTAKVINNVVGNTRGFGIHLWHSPHDVLIFNNTTFNNDEAGITVGNGEHGTVATGCIVANNISPDGITEAGDVRGNIYVNNLTPNGVRLKNGTETGRLSGDAKFVNYRDDGTGDYRPQAGSPAIGKASTKYAPTTDADGNARDGQPDLGAYELR